MYAAPTSAAVRRNTFHISPDSIGGWNIPAGPTLSCEVRSTLTIDRGAVEDMSRMRSFCKLACRARLRSSESSERSAVDGSHASNRTSPSARPIQVSDEALRTPFGIEASSACFVLQVPHFLPVVDGVWRDRATQPPCQFRATAATGLAPRGAELPKRSCINTFWTHSRAAKREVL
jgi:hypothetical protein